MITRRPIRGAVAGALAASPGVCAAADEVYDFETVAVSERCSGPGIARDNFAVVLDGDAVLFEGEGGEKIIESGTGREVREIPRLAVDEEVHALNVAGPGRPSAEKAPKLPAGKAEDRFKKEGEAKAAENSQAVVGQRGPEFLLGFPVRISGQGDQVRKAEVRIDGTSGHIFL